MYALLLSIAFFDISTQSQVIQEITVVKQIDHIETIGAFSIAGYKANRPIEN